MMSHENLHQPGQNGRPRFPRNQMEPTTMRRIPQNFVFRPCDSGETFTTGAGLGSVGMMIMARIYRRIPVPQRKTASTQASRTSVESRPKYSATPPQMPSSIRSARDLCKRRMVSMVASVVLQGGEHSPSLS